MERIYLALALAVALASFAVSIKFTSYGEPKGDNEVVRVTQYIEDFGTQHNDQEPKIINLLGYWDVNQNRKLVISFKVNDNVINKQEILDYSNSVIFGGSDNRTTWVSTLSLLDKEKEKLFPRIVNADSSVSSVVKEESDIRIHLTSDKYPTGRFGQSVLYIYDNIISAEITIFDVDTLYQDGYLAHILEHEMGHALGLGHSNDKKSVMYPRVVIVNDSIIGEIINCEENGLTSLYEAKVVESIHC